MEAPPKRGTKTGQISIDSPKKLKVIPKPLRNAIYGVENAKNEGLGIGSNPARLRLRLSAGVSFSGRQQD